MMEAKWPGASTTMVTVTCTPPLLVGLLVTFTVQLASGDSGNQSSRYMIAGSFHLSYNVYTDAPHTSIEYKTRVDVAIA